MLRSTMAMRSVSRQLGSPRAAMSAMCLNRMMSTVPTYRSTRGGQTGLKFGDVVLQGLGTDRGLLVPETLPTFPAGAPECWVAHLAKGGVHGPFQTTSWLLVLATTRHAVWLDYIHVRTE